MDETQNIRKVYYIPENYIKENRVHIGQLSFRLGYLLDSLILSAFLGIFAAIVVVLFMNGTSFSSKLTVILIICGPGFLAGQIGFNGDRLSVAFKSFRNWNKNKTIRIYNSTPRLLGSDPLKDLDEPTGRDTIVEVVNNMRESMRKRAEEGELVEGETFEFEFDPSIDDHLEENGDFDSGENFDTDISINTSEWDPDSVHYVFSSDGYNEEDDYEDINFSDFETN